MKKLMIMLMLLGLVFQTSVFAEQNWLVKGKRTDNSHWVLHRDGTIVNYKIHQYDYAQAFVRLPVGEVGLYDENDNLVVSIYEHTVYDYTDGYKNEEGHNIPVKREPTKEEQLIWKYHIKK